MKYFLVTLRVKLVVMNIPFVIKKMKSHSYLNKISLHLYYINLAIVFVFPQTNCNNMNFMHFLVVRHEVLMFV